MRVSQKLLFEVSSRELERSAGKLLDLQRQAASTLRVNRPSDDPIAAQRAIELKASERRVDPALRTAQYVKSWLAVTETALGDMKDAALRAKELALSESSDTADAQSRQAAAIEVRHLYERVVQAANTKLGDRYIFSGTETRTAPVTRDADYNPDYTHGNQETIEVRLFGDQTVTLNLTVEGAGRGVLETSGVLESLRDLNDALEADDTALIADEIDNLDTALEELGSYMAEAGSRTASIEGQEGSLQQMQADLEETVSKYLDADLDKVLVELSNQQIIYQAALKTAAGITRYSLMNFIE